MKKYLFALAALSLLFACTGKEEEAPVVKVQSITIEQRDMTLTEGESVNLSAIVQPENAADKTVNWSSSNESVVMVSSNGKAMALSLGKAIITAKSGDKSDFITITVEAKVIPVTGVSLDKAQITIKVGESETLTPTITPEDATNKKVSWTSSNDKVATVEDGKVVGVQPGTVTITVTTEDGAKTAECPVTVKSNLAPSVTVGAEHISAVSAILSGEANLETTSSADLSMGIMWSTNSGVLPSNSTKTEAKEINAYENSSNSYYYSVSISELTPSTTYYYRSYVTQNGQNSYGEIKEFTTKDLSSLLHTLGATSISAVSACLNASLDLTDVHYVSKSLGFYWGSSTESVNSKVAAKEGSGSISTDLSKLTPSKEYFFQAFIMLDGKEYMEDVSSFTTKEVASLLETRDASGVEATTATLNAKLDLTDVQYKSITYGFLWGTSESALNTDYKCTEISDNSISAALTNLSHKTQYWYKAYVTLDSKTFYGEVKTFTTDVVPVESVSLDKTEYTFNTIGNTLTLKATVLPADATDKSVKWSSDKEDVATVDADGLVTAKGNGKATITVTTKDQGKTANCEVTVAQWVTSISLDKTSITLNEGQEQTLIPTVNPSNAADKSLNWTSSNTSVATVNAEGKVTAVSKGTATIKAEAKDGSGKNASCSVTVKRPVSSIQLNKTSIAIYNGKTEALTATVIPSDANNTAVTWTSSNTSVATVSSSGVVTGKSKGTATITVTANDGNGAQATCAVEVKQYVTRITLDKTSITLNEGQEQMLIPTVNPSTAADKSLNWTSSNTSVATVNAEGKVTAVSKGTATIKAEAKDGSGKYASCSVTVKRIVSSIQLNKTSLVLYLGASSGSERLTATVIPSDASNTAITWTSSNTSVATVSSSGVVIGNSKGTATITVTAKDGNGAQATCAVEVKQYVTSISLDKSSLLLEIGAEANLSVTSILPDNANDKTYTWSSSDSAIASVDNSGKVTAKAKGKATIKATANDGSGVFVSCSVEVCRIDVPQAVDMGTVVDGKNIKWASFNIGASSPEEYGLYYAWGETAPKENYSASSYKWYNEYSTTKYNTGSSSSGVVYGIVDNKTVLEPVDDVASVKLGGKWRIPTDAEWTELRTKCTWTWKTNYNGSGINGRLVTASNGNSIFLPAAGIREDTSLYNAGSCGGYWSSSLFTDLSYYAWYVYFGSDGVSGYGLDRYYGQSVRPVTE